MPKRPPPPKMRRPPPAIGPADLDRMVAGKPASRIADQPAGRTAKQPASQPARPSSAVRERADGRQVVQKISYLPPAQAEQVRMFCVLTNWTYSELTAYLLDHALGDWKLGEPPPMLPARKKR